ncbi:fumarylacetoacetate hydrolase family protein [Bradyrhizobium sp. Cp5.3]|uniref:fumarylacetoacetate hydrolase family protein n=1 Tax=Bradyrhizobium sp. Cp5.3 TaxID=443598 RepID=UPI00040E14E0|nr:fumarylacetoacetate hydrolase family protein [Bradyrhizobium sp. Cp5.3]
MKIVSFTFNNSERLGVADGDNVIDLQAVDPAVPNDLGDWLRQQNGDLEPLRALAKRAPASARRSIEQVKYGLPVARPGKILCLGLNYMDHVKEGRHADNVPKWPSLFFRVLSSFVPHNASIIRPLASEQFDYEAEMVAVVGTRARHLTISNALDCIVGYSIANDGSIRDFQRHTTQWTIGKNFDRSGSIGPWFISSDELPRGGAGLKIQSRLNGKVMQSDNTENLMFPLAETLVYVTKAITLEPGDIILTGTPSGVGQAQKPNPVWMKAGDVCEIEVEGIGVLRNIIEDERS